MRGMDEYVVLAGRIAAGQLAGVFFVFAMVIMPVLRGVDDHTFVVSMNRINVSLVNPVFVLIFLGAEASPRGHACPNTLQSIGSRTADESIKNPPNTRNAVEVADAVASSLRGWLRLAGRCGAGRGRCCLRVRASSVRQWPGEW